MAMHGSKIGRRIEPDDMVKHGFKSLGDLHRTTQHERQWPLNPLGQCGEAINIAFAIVDKLRTSEEFEGN